MNTIFGLIVFALFLLGWMGTGFGWIAFKRSRQLITAYEAIRTNDAVKIFDLENTLERERQERVAAVLLEGTPTPAAVH